MGRGNICACETGLVRGRVVCLYLVRGRVACASIEGLGTRRREGGDKSFGDVFFLGGRGPFSVINNIKGGKCLENILIS